MKDMLNRSRKILYYALAIACVIGILWTLYRIGFSSYSLTYKYQAKWFPEEMTAYKIYHSVFLGYVSDICFYAGLVSVFALWKKPRPTWMFVLIAAAVILPKLVLGAINHQVDTNAEFVNYYFSTPNFNIVTVLFSLIWTITKLIVVAKLYTDAEKTAKPVLLIYFILIIIGILQSYVYISYLINLIIYSSDYELMKVIGVVRFYLWRSIDLLWYIITLRFLKKSLGEDMPFTKTLRLLKEQCINKAPE